MEMIYTNAKIVSDGAINEGFDVFTKDGIITDIKPHTDSTVGTDLEGNYLSPGFIDIHCHGAGGFEFIDATDTAVTNALDIHKNGGTRVIYPTISATDTKTTLAALKTLKTIKPHGIEIAGVHLEGPYLAPEMCGAQDTTFIRPPDREEYVQIIDMYGDIIKRWTYAPEYDKDGAFANYLTMHGIKPSAGHTAAKYSDMVIAKRNGLNAVTHLYSCTSTVVRENCFRKLGVIESAFLLDDIYVEAIGDLCHLPKELLQMIIKIKGKQRVALVSDAIRFAGIKDTKNLKSIGNIEYIVEDGVAKLADKSAFAGSIVTTGDILKRAVSAGISIQDTVYMLTKTPADLMGLCNYGSIRVGNKASFTVFDDNLDIKTL